MSWYASKEAFTELGPWNLAFLELTCQRLLSFFLLILTNFALSWWNSPQKFNKTNYDFLQKITFLITSRLFKINSTTLEIQVVKLGIILVLNNFVPLSEILILYQSRFGLGPNTRSVLFSNPLNKSLFKVRTIHMFVLPFTMWKFFAHVAH